VAAAGHKISQIGASDGELELMAAARDAWQVAVLHPDGCS
jgi:hypothetical protein